MAFHPFRQCTVVTQRLGLGLQPSLDYIEAPPISWKRSVLKNLVRGLNTFYDLRGSGLQTNYSYISRAGENVEAVIVVYTLLTSASS